MTKVQTKCHKNTPKASLCSTNAVWRNNVAVKILTIL